MKLSEMMSVGSSMTSHTIGEIRKLEADLAAVQRDKGLAELALNQKSERLVQCEEALAAAQAQIAGNAELIGKLVDEAAAAQADNERLYGWMKTKDGQIATIEADWKKAEADAAALRVLLGSVVQQNIAFRWDGEKQCHVPWIMVEFAEVPSGEPSTAKGWRDRDAFAAAIDQARKESGNG